MPAKQWPAARNAWSRLAGPTTNELVPELGSTENLPDIAGRVGFMPRAGGCAMARWGRGWVSAPAQHRDHLRAVPPACRARNLTRNLTRLTGWKSVKRPPARLADRSGPLVFAGWQSSRPCFRRARARSSVLSERRQTFPYYISVVQGSGIFAWQQRNAHADHGRRTENLQARGFLSASESPLNRTLNQPVAVRRGESAVLKRAPCTVYYQSEVNTQHARSAKRRHVRAGTRKLGRIGRGTRIDTRTTSTGRRCCRRCF